MPVSSLLADYATNYSAKLRAALGIPSTPKPSALAPQTPPAPTGGSPDMSAAPTMDQQDPGSADPSGGMAPPVQQPMSELDGDAEQPMQQSALEGGDKGKGGYSFRQAFKDAPKEAREQQVTKLEATLKQGNQTIDQAYDEMVKQLGAPPEKHKKLSREEKGMLLMEFGMSMLANSRKGFATAAGEAGSQTLGSYAQMSQGPALQYDASRAAIEGARTKDKATLARQSALESVKTPPGGGSKLPGKFTGEDGYVYFYDENGVAKKATDESGKPIKGDVSGGASARGFESDSKYKRYLEIYGVNPLSGEPLSGIDLERVKRDALDFANDRGASIDDLDLDIKAEDSADKEMGADAYRDLTPEQREIQRNKIADDRRKRLTRPNQRRSALGGQSEPHRGGGKAAPKRYNSENDARAAAARGDIQRGDTVIINGEEATVE